MWKTAFKKFEEISVLTLICLKWVPRDTSTIFVLTAFTQKMLESWNSMYSSILMLENIWYHYLSEYHHLISSVDGIHKRLRIFTNSFWVPGTHDWNKIHKILWIQSTAGKMMIHMFSSMKKEDCVEFKPSGIFQVKVVTEDIVFRSLGTQRKAAFAIWCLFLKKHTIFWTKLLRSSVFLWNSTLVSFMWEECHFV